MYVENTAVNLPISQHSNRYRRRLEFLISTLDRISLCVTHSVPRFSAVIYAVEPSTVNDTNMGSFVPCHEKTGFLPGQTLRS